MIEVARGRLSKQIAGDIGIAEATVKVHRSRAMRKMNAHSLPDSAEWPTNSNSCREAVKLPNRALERPAFGSTRIRLF